MEVATTPHLKNRYLCFFAAERHTAFSILGCDVLASTSHDRLTEQLDKEKRVIGDTRVGASSQFEGKERYLHAALFAGASSNDEKCLDFSSRRNLH